MNKPVSLQFTPEAKDYVNAVYSYYFYDRGTRVFLLVLLVESVCVAIPYVLGLATGFFLGGPVSWFVAGMLVCAALMLVFVAVQPVCTGQWARNNERLLCEHSLQADDSQIVVANKFVETKLDWGSFREVVEAKAYYLLLTATIRRLFYFVPRRAFESPEQESAFRDLVREHVERHRLVGSD